MHEASALTRMSQFDQARTRYEEAAALYSMIGRRQGLAAVLVNGGIVSVHLGLLDKAEAQMRKSHELFASLGNVRGQAACAINLAFVHLLRKDPAAAKEVSLAALDIARSMQHSHYEASALSNLGQAERDLGDLDGAIEQMSAGVAIRRANGTAAENIDDIVNLAYVYMLAGDPDSARPLGEEMWPALESMSMVVFMPQFALWMAAQVFRGLGQRERAKAMLEKAHAAVETQASLVASPAERASFLALEPHKEIEAAFSRKRWPPLGIPDGSPAAAKRVPVKAGDDAR
jgi:tetratricopeptide (TPR) repeat protein